MLVTVTAKVTAMETAMETVKVMAKAMKPQTLPAKAMEKRIAMARETETLMVTALAMPRQSQGLVAKTKMELEPTKRTIDASLAAR